MALLNVRYVLLKIPGGSKFVTWQLEMPYHSPIIVSGTIEPPLDSPTGIDLMERFRMGPILNHELIRSQVPQVGEAFATVLGMGVSKKRPVAERIFIRDLARPVSLETNPDVRVISHHVYNQRVELQVDVTQDCYARLAYTYYPHIDLLVDGVRVEPHETAGHFMALYLTAGEHEVVIQPYLSTLRRGLLLASILALLGTAWSFFNRRQQRLCRDHLG
jgi:hypothetical protein